MTDTRCANGRDGRVLDARKALCGLTRQRQTQSAWRNSGQVKLYLGGTVPEVVWQACPATRLEVPGRPAAVLHKAADFSHRTEADSEGCPSQLTDGVRALHFPAWHSTFL